MRRRLARLHPSPSMAVALTALFIALGGVSYGVATGSIDSREVKNNSLRGKDLRKSSITAREIKRRSIDGTDIKINRVGGNAVKEEGLESGKIGKVPNAATADNATNANTLQGAPPSAFAAAANFRLVKAKLAIGQTAVLAQNGPVSVVASCDVDDNGTPGDVTDDNERLRILGATTAANSFQDGSDDFNGGAAATDFLQPSTPPDDRVLFSQTNGALNEVDVANDIDDGFVAGPNGEYVAVQGETLALGLNAFGAKCALHGAVFVDSF